MRLLLIVIALSLMVVSVPVFMAGAARVPAAVPPGAARGIELLCQPLYLLGWAIFIFGGVVRCYVVWRWPKLES
jgi:hypothetical protein